MHPLSRNTHTRAHANINPGNTGERFYIINDGEVVVTVQQGSGKPKELTRLSTQVTSLGLRVEG